MVGIAFNFDRAAVTLLDEQSRRVSAEWHRTREVTRPACLPCMLVRNARHNLLARRAATGRAGQGERCPHQCAEAAPRDVIRRIAERLGKLLSEQLLTP